MAEELFTVTRDGGRAGSEAPQKFNQSKGNVKFHLGQYEQDFPKRGGNEGGNMIKGVLVI